MTPSRGNGGGHSALAAFWDARSAVLGSLALGGRDSDLLDLVETVFLARLDGDESLLDELIARGGHDIADVRSWWSSWERPPHRWAARQLWPR